MTLIVQTSSYLNAKSLNKINLTTKSCTSQTLTTQISTSTKTSLKKTSFVKRIVQVDLTENKFRYHKWESVMILNTRKPLANGKHKRVDEKHIKDR